MRRGDVLSVDLGSPAQGGGREQAGRRPAIAVLSDASPATNPMAIVVPLTSKLAAMRFPYTIQVQPTPVNGLTSPSVLLVFQLRAVDLGRVNQVIGHLEDDYLKLIDDTLRQMLAL